MSGAQDSGIPHTAMPPYARGLDVAIDGEMDGRAILIMPWSKRVMGRPGFFHGGAITGLLELAGLVLLRDQLALEDPTARFKPINVTTSFMRGAVERDCRAVAQVERLGRNLANISAIAWQDSPDKPIASAQLAYRIRRAG
jgi:uncharacterized protein (TIGR00369 family)